MAQFEDLASVADPEARNLELQERQEILAQSTGIGFDFQLHELGSNAAEWLCQDSVMPEVELWEQQVQTIFPQNPNTGVRFSRIRTKQFSGWPVGFETVMPGIAGTGAPSGRRPSMMSHYLVNYEDGSFSGLLARGGDPLTGREFVSRDKQRAVYRNPNYRLWEGDPYVHFERLQTIRDGIVSLLRLYGAI